MSALVAILAACLGFAAGWLWKRSRLLRQLEALEAERVEWRELASDLAERNRQLIARSQQLRAFADAALRAELERGGS